MVFQQRGEPHLRHACSLLGPGNSVWGSTFPGIAVMTLGLAFSLLGDGPADALAVPL